MPHALLRERRRLHVRRWWLALPLLLLLVYAALVAQLAWRQERLLFQPTKLPASARLGRSRARCQQITTLSAPCGNTQVCRARAFTPGPDDVGHTLKFECQPVDAQTGQPLAPPTVLLIPQRVIAQPQPLPRRMIPIVPDAERVGRFTVLSYNVLADLYASVSAQGPRLRPACFSPPRGRRRMRSDRHISWLYAGGAV